MNYEIVNKNIRLELENYIIKNNLKSLVLGVSGGIDSALVAVLAKPVCDKLNIPLIGRSITIATNSPEERKRAMQIGKVFCTDFNEVDLTSHYNVIYSGFEFDNTIKNVVETDIESKIRHGNIKARLRMIYLYNLASANKGLVLSTDNWTEYLLGFWTLHGDHSDFGMIQSLWKSEVYELSEWLVFNELDEYPKPALLNCIECQATDGLGISSTDLDQIMPGWEGSSREGYKKVDSVLSNYTILNIGDKTNPIIKRHLDSQFKRNWPIIIERNKIM